jgi:hypothetical protein
LVVFRSLASSKRMLYYSPGERSAQNKNYWGCTMSTVSGKYSESSSLLSCRACHMARWSSKEPYLLTWCMKCCTTAWCVTKYKSQCPPLSTNLEIHQRK